MYASYAVWTAAACAARGRRGRPARPARRRRPPTRPAARSHRSRTAARPPSTAATASYIAPCTMPPSTLLLAGGRPAAIALSAMPLQWTTAFSPGRSAPWTTAAVGPSARAATRATAAARPRRNSALDVRVIGVSLMSGSGTDDATAARRRGHGGGYPSSSSRGTYLAPGRARGPCGPRAGRALSVRGPAPESGAGRGEPRAGQQQQRRDRPCPGDRRQHERQLAAVVGDDHGNTSDVTSPPCSRTSCARAGPFGRSWKSTWKSGVDAHRPSSAHVDLQQPRLESARVELVVPGREERVRNVQPPAVVRELEHLRPAAQRPAGVIRIGRARRRARPGP